MTARKMITRLAMGLTVAATSFIVVWLGMARLFG